MFSCSEVMGDEKRDETGKSVRGMGIGMGYGVELIESSLKR